MQRFIENVVVELNIHVTMTSLCLRTNGYGAFVVGFSFRVFPIFASINSSLERFVVFKFVIFHAFPCTIPF